MHNQDYFGAAVITLAFIIPGVYSVCTNYENWVGINETLYDQSYSPITDAEARPLGFKVATWIYDGPSLCVEVMDTLGKRVEIKFESDPPSRICVTSGDTTYCSESASTLCQEFTAETADQSETTKFEFFCDSGCPEADVNFWYRFVVSPGISSDDDEIWCREQDSKFPGQLLTVPFVRTTEHVSDDNGGYSASLNILSALFTLLMLYMSKN